MAGRQGKKTKKKVGTLAARKLSASKARGVRGGITVTKVTDISSSHLLHEALTGEGKLVKIN
jgi:hypothetical protein